MRSPDFEGRPQVSLLSMQSGAPPSTAEVAPKKRRDGIDHHQPDAVRLHQHRKVLHLGTENRASKVPVGAVYLLFEIVSCSRKKAGLSMNLQASALQG